MFSKYKNPSSTKYKNSSFTKYKNSSFTKLTSHIFYFQLRSPFGRTINKEFNTMIMD
jgi:hypothetical protein